MADDLSRSGFSPETVQREQDPLEEGAGISEPEEAPCLDESMAIAPDNTDELLGSADEAHTPEFPALPPPRSVATPAKPGRYPAPEDTIQLLKELFAGGIMEKGQYEERRKQTPLPDHPFCYTPELDQSIHMFVQLMKTKVGRSAALKIDEASDKQLRDCQDQMIMALAPILMLDHHYNSESLDLDTARDLAVRAAEFLARGIKLQSYQRRLLVLHALNLRNKETEATCYNVWDHNPSPMRGPTSTRAPELFGQILQQDIFSKAKSAMDTCDSMAPLVCPKPQAPLHRPFLNSRGGNSRGRGAAAPYARPPRGFNRTAHQGASSSKSSTPTPTPTKVFKAVSGLESIGFVGSYPGLSQDSTDLLHAAWARSTHSQYASALNQWHGWCNGQQIDPFQPSIINIVNFLSYLFSLGRAYRTVNCHRSALSNFCFPVDGFAVGSHPLVLRLFKGMLRLKPPTPKYGSFWKVEEVLLILRVWDNASLSLKQLTLKCVMLCALSAALRVSELAQLSLSQVRYTPEGLYFTLPHHTKTSVRIGSNARSFLLPKFLDPAVCPCACLQEYLTRRPHIVSTSKSVFVSYVKPHGSVSPSTIARWLKEVLATSGIDTSIFSAHSTRGAAASEASTKGVALDDILKSARWSSASTFTKHYYRPESVSRFGSAVLSAGTK